MYRVFDIGGLYVGSAGTILLPDVDPFVDNIIEVDRADKVLLNLETMTSPEMFPKTLSLPTATMFRNLLVSIEDNAACCPTIDLFTRCRCFLEYHAIVAGVSLVSIKSKY